MISEPTNIQITKPSGLCVPFEKGKLKQSLMRSGATDEQADEVANEIIQTYGYDAQP